MEEGPAAAAVEQQQASSASEESATAAAVCGKGMQPGSSPAVDGMFSVPLNLSAVSPGRSLAVKTPSPKESQLQQQQQQAVVGGPRAKAAPAKRAFACCMRPAVQEDEECHSSCTDGSTPTSDSLSPMRKRGQRSAWHSGSPKHALRAQVLMQQGSAAYSDAEWFDARSEISSALSSTTSDHAAKLEELSAMLKDMHHSPQAVGSPAAQMLSPRLGPAVTKAPWIPEPALAFGEPNMLFVPVTARTGFAAYWERDPARSTPYPTPIDVMIGASALAMRSHASIPGIWLQESDKAFSVTVKPRFMPPGLPRYTETYDKSNATEPHWPMRRDLRLGSTSGQLYMTADGMLVLRARSKPLFGSSHDYIMEEYMRLEEGGQVIVDRMCCLCIKTGRRATQYVVGHHHAVPPRGHV